MLKHFLSKAVCAALLLLMASAYGQAAASMVDPKGLLLPDDATTQATLYPKMTLLTGPVLVVKYIDPTHFSRSDAYDGDGFIIGVYLGQDDLNDVSSPMLVSNMKSVKTISDLHFFSTYDPNKTGQLSKKVLREGQFVLMYYNFNGYLLMRSMANYGVSYLQYDIATGQIKLALTGGIQEAKFLQGQLIDFGPLPLQIPSAVKPIVQQQVY